MNFEYILYLFPFQRQIPEVSTTLGDLSLKKINFAGAAAPKAKPSAVLIENDEHIMN